MSICFRLSVTTATASDDPWPIVGACLLDARRILPEALGARRRRFQPEENVTVAAHTRTTTSVKEPAQWEHQAAAVQK